MTGLVTTSTATPEDTIVESDITNGDFFPAVAMAEARDSMRLDGTATPIRLRGGLIEAMASVNAELNDFKIKQEVANIAKLADVPANKIDDISINVHRYFRAVHCLAKANLVERYRDYDSTNAANRNQDDNESTIDDLRRDARWAINDIMGIGRSTIEQI